MLKCEKWSSIQLRLFVLICLIVNMGLAQNSSDFNEKMINLCSAFQTGGMERLAEFASPNFPQKYPANTDCIRVIHAPPNYDIVFRFNQEVFRIETSYEDSLGPIRTISPNCPNDYLEIRDGRYSFSPLIGRFCGLEAPQDEIRVRSGYAWLNFHSDSLLEERGFSAEYEFVRRSHAIQQISRECHFSYVLHLDGYINVTALSDFYKAGRPSNQSLECVYQIRVPNWLRVAIFIEQFELAAPNQCPQNYLEIYAGPTAREPLKRYCGIIATHTYTSQTTVFLRLFVASEFHAQHTKLRILFSSYLAQKNCSENNLFECGDDICIPELLVCNGNTNCLYRRDEAKCNEYQNILTTILLNSYSPLVLLPIIIACAIIILAFVYKPWLATSNSSQVLEVDVKEGTPLTATRQKRFNTTTNTTSTTAKSSRTDAPTQISSRRESATTKSAKKRTSFAMDRPSIENGECQHSQNDVWQSIAEISSTLDSGEPAETSFVSIDV